MSKKIYDKIEELLFTTGDTDLDRISTQHGDVNDIERPGNKKIYKTHIQIPFVSREQEEEEEEEKEIKDEDIKEEEKDEPEEDTEKTEPIESPESDSDFGYSISPDENVGMGLGEEEPKTAEEIGRGYELKKIYARLVSIESYLSDFSAAELLKLRNMVSKAIELFETIISNFDSYKDRIDDIIVIYYKFIARVYTIVKKFYKEQAK